MVQERHIGQLAGGVYADLLIVDGEPTLEAAVLADPQSSIRLSMQGGKVISEQW